MLTKCCACDNKEAFVSKPRDGEITFDAAAFVETLSVDQIPNRYINLISTNTVEELQCPRSAYFKFVEGGFVKETRIFTCHQMFVTYCA